MKIKLYELAQINSGNDDKAKIVDTEQDGWKDTLDVSEVSLIETTMKYNEIITMGCMVAEPVNPARTDPRFK